MSFKNRTEAGRLLAEKLIHLKGKNAVVLAIPRGGLPVAAPVARALDIPMDVVLSKKIGHPFNKEYAIGAVSLEQLIITNPEGVSDSYIEEEAKEIRKLLRERERRYHRKSSAVDLKDKIVIVVDDGVATGNTLKLTLKVIQSQNPEKIVLAIPVAPPEAFHMLKNLPEVSEIICLHVPHFFRAVGQFYEDFRPVTDPEAIEILESTPGRSKIS